MTLCRFITAAIGATISAGCGGGLSGRPYSMIEAMSTVDSTGGRSYVIRMKPLRWRMPLFSAVVALAFGFVPYALWTYTAKIPTGLRDNPWPMELIATAATVATVALVVSAYRQKRARAVATVSALVATAATLMFVLLLHVGSYMLPPPPKDLAVGTQAADFVLPDEAGQPVALASTRGHPTLLVFYRGEW